MWRLITRGSVVVSMAFVAAGCGRAAFGGALGEYDQQACTENALRHHPDATVIARALQQFGAGCHDGEMASCSALGVMHELGLGTPSDPVRAVELYERACRGDNARGCVNLGAMLVRGVGVEANAPRAEVLFTQACRRDVMSGCAQLGRMTITGAMTTGRGDLQYGRRLLERACLAKERNACLALGDALTALDQSHDALVAYTRACLEGDELACHRMDAPVIQTSQEAAAGWRK